MIERIESPRRVYSPQHNAQGTAEIDAPEVATKGNDTMIISGADPSYFVGWGTLALINAGLAQGKNFSGLLWFVASLFLGPIATFFIVVMEKRALR